MSKKYKHCTIFHRNKTASIDKPQPTKYHLTAEPRTWVLLGKPLVN